MEIPIWNVSNAEKTIPNIFRMAITVIVWPRRLSDQDNGALNTSKV